MELIDDDYDNMLLSWCVDTLSTTTGTKKRRERKEKMDSKQSIWGQLLTRLEAIGPDMEESLNQFEKRFRITYTTFLLLNDKIKEAGFQKCNSVRPEKQQADLRLLLMGSLKVLGSGFTFTDVSDLCGVSQESLRVFFHSFCSYISTNIANYVNFDKNLEGTLASYSKVELPGCVGSMDNIHILWDRCPASEANRYHGKEGRCSVSFFVVTDHERNCLYVSDGFAGTLF